MKRKNNELKEKFNKEKEHYQYEFEKHQARFMYWFDEKRSISEENRKLKALLEERTRPRSVNYPSFNDSRIVQTNEDGNTDSINLKELNNSKKQNSTKHNKVQTFLSFGDSQQREDEEECDLIRSFGDLCNSR